MLFFFREAEDDFEFRRQELVSNFDEVIRKREHEFRAKLDETSNVLLANDLKVLYMYVHVPDGVVVAGEVCAVACCPHLWYTRKNLTACQQDVFATGL